jgi:heat shock protein HslJ
MRTLFAATLALLAACTTGNGVTLDGTNWRLVDVGGRPPVAGEAVTLQFAEGKISGFASCNNYNASYTTSGTTLTLGPAASTRRACIEDARNAQETAYLGALAKVASYTVSGDRLTLTDATGAPLATFERVR